MFVLACVLVDTVSSEAGCCFPQQYSYRLLGSTFAGDLGLGQDVGQYVARTPDFVAWRFQMSGVQLNGSTGWVGFMDNSEPSNVITGGFEFSVSNAAGTQGYCCKATGGNLDWVVPARCTNESGLAPAGTVNLLGKDMAVWSQWIDPVLKRRWSLVTTPDCVPLFSTGSDVRSFYSAYYDNTGYLAADWKTDDESVNAFGAIPLVCSSASLCVDPKWKPSDVKPTLAKVPKLPQPNLGLHPSDLLANPSSLPLPSADALPPLSALPDSFDWDLDKHKVTPPSDQRALTCGACWAHAATGLIESARAIFGDGQLVPLSVQQLIDCARGTYSSGCGGGATTEAFAYANTVGLQTAATYPLSSVNGACDVNPNQPKVKIHSWGGAQFLGNEALMRAALFQSGPLTVGVSINGWGLYNGGVLTSCGSAVSHVAMVTGWGTDKATGIPYWRVRNSFGPTWGENGFIRILRGYNTCGLEAAAFWVLYANSSLV